jgi:hypothetical protein
MWQHQGINGNTAGWEIPARGVVSAGSDISR